MSRHRDLAIDTLRSFVALAETALGPGFTPGQLVERAAAWQLTTHVDA